MLAEVTPGASEHAICAAILDAIHRSGAVLNDPFLIMTWGVDDVGWSEPAWTYSGGPPRIVEPGDLFMAELFPAYGGLETQQQMSIAVAPVEPDIEELGKVANQAYTAGLGAARPGNTFDDVVNAMVEPVNDYGGWTLTPMIHCVAPLGWTGGMAVNRERMPNQLTTTPTKTPVDYQNVVLTLRKGMSFAFEPNCCKGQRRVNVGGSIVIADGEPEQLNSICNVMHIVE